MRIGMFIGNCTVCKGNISLLILMRTIISLTNATLIISSLASELRRLGNLIQFIRILFQKIDVLDCLINHQCIEFKVVDLRVHLL